MSLMSLHLRDNEVLGLAFAALAVLISAGGKIDGGGALDVIYIFVLQLGPTVHSTRPYNVLVWAS